MKKVYNLVLLYYQKLIYSKVFEDESGKKATKNIWSSGQNQRLWQILEIDYAYDIFYFYSCLMFLKSNSKSFGAKKCVITGF